MDLEELPVIHASPTLANLKPASLISLSKATNEIECLKKLESRGLMFFPMFNMKGQKLLLVYRKDKLKHVLASPSAEKILRYFEYPGSFDGRLEFLKRRFVSTLCPHEVGIFLGYPPEDVMGFIENNGQRALYSGLWKVYFDVENAEKTLQKWEKCRRKYVECFHSGTDITRLCVTA